MLTTVSCSWVGSRAALEDPAGRKGFFTVMWWIMVCFTAEIVFFSTSFSQKHTLSIIIEGVTEVCCYQNVEVGFSGSFKDGFVHFHYLFLWFCSGPAETGAQTSVETRLDSNKLRFDVFRLPFVVLKSIDRSVKWPGRGDADVLSILVIK